VTSKRQKATNRLNSAKSTGPRTRTGKAAARLNARLHGLASAVRGEPGADAEIERLAAAIANEAGRPDLIEFARRIAETEVDVRRIRSARAMLEKIPPVSPTFYRMAKSPNERLFKTALRQENRRKQTSMKDFADRLDALGWDPDAPAFVEVPLKFRARADRRPEILARYERRATSRRKSAIRRFDAQYGAGSPTALE
jgi:hypothetical protein